MTVDQPRPPGFAGRVPTRSPTHEDVPIARLASMGMELEEIAEGEVVAINAIAELAEDRGRPASHYLAAVSLATELKVGPEAPVSVRVCVGTCQRYGALDMLDHLVARWGRSKTFVIAPVSCLDQCDKAPACEVHGAHGKLLIAPTTTESLDEALDSLSS